MRIHSWRALAGALALAVALDARQGFAAPTPADGTALQLTLEPLDAAMLSGESGERLDAGAPSPVNDAAPGPAASPETDAETASGSGADTTTTVPSTTTTPAPTPTTAYAKYEMDRHIAHFHKVDFPTFSLRNLTKALRAREAHHGRDHHDHGHGKGWWGWGHGHGHSDHDGHDHHSDHDGRDHHTDDGHDHGHGHADHDHGETVDEVAVATYLEQVYRHGPSCIIFMAFLILCCGCCINCCGCGRAVSRVKRRNAAAAALAKGEALPISTGRWERCAEKCNERTHAKMQKGSVRYRLVLGLIATLFIASFCLFGSMHKWEARQDASIQAVADSVDSVAAWADGVSAQITAVESKINAADALAAQALADPMCAADPTAAAALTQVRTQLGGVVAGITEMHGGNASVGVVASDVITSTSDASEYLHDALYELHERRRHAHWGGFLFLFFVLWLSLSLNLKSTVIEKARSRLCLNFGVGFVRLFTMWTAFIGAACVLFVVLVASDFCFDARANLLMLTTDNNPAAPSYTAFNYYLNCGGYDQARLVNEYPFADATGSVAGALAHSEAALASLPAGACGDVGAGLAGLVSSVSTLTVGAGGMLPTTPGGAGGQLQCAELNAPLEGLLSTFCGEAYTPVLMFWCILMWVGVLLCLSEVLQKCLHRARIPESVLREQHAAVRSSGKTVDYYNPSAIVVNPINGPGTMPEKSAVLNMNDVQAEPAPAYDARTGQTDYVV